MRYTEGIENFLEENNATRKWPAKIRYYHFYENGEEVFTEKSETETRFLKLLELIIIVDFKENKKPISEYRYHYAEYVEKALKKNNEPLNSIFIYDKKEVGFFDRLLEE